MILEDVLKEAVAAKPPGREGKWQKVYVIYRQLRENGFTGVAAVDWMLGKGVIVLKKRHADGQLKELESARHALRMRWDREHRG